MNEQFIQSWRWYGPEDPVRLSDVKQAGATGIVTALHYIPHGEVWPLEDIKKRQQEIEAAGLRWEVVESVNVHEAIKTRSGDYAGYLEKYKETLRNLAACGIRRVCYNFMPVLDWTRTQLDYRVADGSRALRFDWTDLAVFDVHILKRAGAEADYAPQVLQTAQERFSAYDAVHTSRLSDNILMGVPGEASATTDQLLQSIAIYKNLGRDGLRDNLAYFLENIMDTCEEQEVKMTIHPDDPPFSILGLPRIVTSLEDILWLLKRVDRSPNGLCYCTGSLGAGQHNNLVEILQQTGDRVYFAHLRNVRKEADGSFYEADHLAGDNDMYAIMKSLVAAQQQQAAPIPLRPDHGHQMLDDLNKQTNPGYSAIGRLRGLAELRGLELGIRRSLPAEKLSGTA